MPNRLLIKQSLEGLIVPPSTPPLNNPPVWDTQPSIVATFGTAENFDMNDISSDPDLDTITFSLNTGTAPLGAGWTWTPATGILAYDGIGAVNVTSGHIFTLDDGTDTTDSDTVDIIIATSVVMDNWPFIGLASALSSVNDRLDNHPPKGIIEVANWFLHQGINFRDTSSRANTRSRFATLRAANPDVNIIIHNNFNKIRIDAGSNVAAGWMETLMYADSANFDDWVLKRTDGEFLSFVTNQAQNLAFQWNGSAAVRTQVVDRMYEDFSDNDGAENMMPIDKLNLWNDVLSERPGARYAREVHAGGITSITAQDEIDIPTWVSPPTTGSPDGDGYLSLSSNHRFISIKSNRTNASEDLITGYQTINGSTGRVRLSTNTSFTVSASDDFAIFKQSGGSKTSNTEMSDADRLTGILDVFDKFQAKALADDSVAVGHYANGGASTGNDKEAGDAPSHPSAYVGKWEGWQYERIGTASAGFFQNTNSEYRTGGVGGQKSYDVDRLMRNLEYNKLMLISDGSSVTGYPCVFANAQGRANGGSITTRYTNNDVLDAAFYRFYTLLSWCMTNVCPQVEMDQGHDEPVLLDERIISAGDPITTRNFGTYDPTDPTPTSKGVFTFDSPDFGTHGFPKEFDNCLAIPNLRPPDDLTIPWIPSWQPGGQTIDISKDRYTLISAGVDKKWQRFNRVTYVNPDSTSKFFNKKATDFDTNEKILKDTVLNDPTLGPQPGGGYLAGDTIDIGALEAIVLMRVDV